MLLYPFLSQDIFWEWIGLTDFYRKDKVDMQFGAGMSLSMLHPLMACPVVHLNPFAASML